MSWIVLGSVKGKMDTLLLNEAVNNIRDGLLILEELKIRAFSAQGYLFLGELFADAGRKKEALESLKKAETLYKKMKVTPKSYWLKRAREAIAKLESTH
jgi:tetratricopeptide (TPR) repeat protein